MLMNIKKIKKDPQKDPYGQKIKIGDKDVFSVGVVDEAIDVFEIKSVRPYVGSGYSDIPGDVSVIYFKGSPGEKKTAYVHVQGNWEILKNEINELRKQR